MMVLYDRLYRSVAFDIIPVKDYLPALIDEITRNFPCGIPLRVEQKIDDFMLDTGKMQLLGIILNEILTNIIKHAFAGRDSGRINILASIEAPKVRLSIQDNGIGVPETILPSTSQGFGLKLVDMLATQLGGSIHIERDQGTRFILEFDQ